MVSLLQTIMTSQQKHFQREISDLVDLIRA